jgi:hypothetical protein
MNNGNHIKTQARGDQVSRETQHQPPTRAGPRQDRWTIHSGSGQVGGGQKPAWEHGRRGHGRRGRGQAKTNIITTKGRARREIPTKRPTLRNQMPIKTWPARPGPKKDRRAGPFLEAGRARGGPGPEPGPRQDRRTFRSGSGRAGGGQRPSREHGRQGRGQATTQTETTTGRTRGGATNRRSLRHGMVISKKWPTRPGPKHKDRRAGPQSTTAGRARERLVPRVRDRCTRAPAPLTNKIRADIRTTTFFLNSAADGHTRLSC